jgi:hypothetical protein
MEPAKTFDSVEPTIMAVREELMAYFTGGCVDVVTKNSGVRRVTTPQPRLPHGYQRDEQALHNRQTILLNSVGIAVVEYKPDTIFLLEHTLHRSPQMRQLRSGIERFIQRYLPDVCVKPWSNETPEKETDDARIFTAEPRAVGQQQNETTFSRSISYDEYINSILLDLPG